MSGPAAIVQQASLGGVLRSQRARVSTMEAQVGRWVYVLPIAPATVPTDWSANDPDAPSFQNSWTNVVGQQPLSFRLHPATVLEIRGMVDGGAVPSVVFTLPENYRPTEGAASMSFTSYDGTVIYTGRVDTNGDVWILATAGSCCDSTLDLVDGNTSLPWSSHSAAAPDLIINSGPVVVDGTRNIQIEFWGIVDIQQTVTAIPNDVGLFLSLWDALNGGAAAPISDDGLTSNWAYHDVTATGLTYFAVTFHAMTRPFLPAAGSHVYSTRVYAQHVPAIGGAVHGDLMPYWQRVWYP